MNVRKAQEEDLDAVVLLASRKRDQYKHFSPVFWNPSKHAEAVQKEFFSKIIKERERFLLVAEEQGKIAGFLFAEIRVPPPVYDPGGKACLVDDFVISGNETWERCGQVLFRKLEAICLEEGVSVLVSVCGRLDEAKKTFLGSTGSSVVSEWFVKELRDNRGVHET